MRMRMRTRSQVRSIMTQYMSSLQLMPLDVSTGSPSASSRAQLRRSGRTSMGGAVTPLDDATPDMDQDIPMDESDEGGETPRKTRSGKRVAIQSPTTDVDAPPTQRRRKSISVRVLHLRNCFGRTDNVYRHSVDHARMRGYKNVCSSSQGRPRGTSQRASDAPPRSNPVTLQHNGLRT
jgi:hypothetical protein